ncbi:MAG: carboxypeptidase regulatory-like domain-containing protein [Candidatus Hydrogenedentes bacterium]|nr:carboxypeptidase regulatory-like domain-containing protein [Candidatus Hydrogenedentota bacterium]
MISFITCSRRGRKRRFLCRTSYSLLLSWFVAVGVTAQFAYAVDPDAFEPDDTPETASWIGLSGDLQAHNFHAAGDEDWAALYVTDPSHVTFQTLGLGLNCDTVLEVYAADGTTLLGSDDNSGEEGGGASTLILSFFENTVVFVRVNHKDPQVAGAGTEYNLKVWREIGPCIESATITGNVTDSVSGEPIAGAEVVVDELLPFSWFYTDLTGNYVITGLSSNFDTAPYNVRARASGYADSGSQPITMVCGGSGTANFSLASNTPELSVNPTELNFPASGGADEVMVQNTGGGTLTWDASIVSGDWFSIQIAKKTGDGSISVTAQANLAATARTGRIRVEAPGANNSPIDVTVNQVGDTTPPAVPAITTNGGVDFTTATAALNLEGTCGADAESILVNGSTAGVAYTAGATTWFYGGVLAEGPNIFSAVATDAAGNQSGAAGITITLDSTPPPAPVITTNGGADFTTEQSALTLEGTCGSDTASILVNGSTTGVTYAPGATTWSYAGVLAEGPNNFSVAARDALGNQSEAATIVITLDTRPVLQVEPNPVNFGAAGGDATITVRNTGPGTLVWDAAITSGNDWLSISISASKITGDGTIVVTAEPNSSPDSRSGAIEVSAPGATPSQVTVNVVQAGTELPPENIDGLGGVDAVDVQLVINAALSIDIGGLDADVNDDGNVNAVDVQLVINAALGL